MSKVKNYYAIKYAKRGNFDRLRTEFKAALTNDPRGETLFNYLDTALANDQFRDAVVANWVRMGLVTTEMATKFRAFSEQEKEVMASQSAAIANGELDLNFAAKHLEAMRAAKKAKNQDEAIVTFNQMMGTSKHTFDVNLGDFVETNVLPLLDVLMRTAPLIADINIMYDTKHKDLIEFGEEKDAEALAKGNAGTEADDVTRKAETLNNSGKKIQASTTVNRTDLLDLDPFEVALFFARLVNRVKYKMQQEILYADGSGNRWTRGFINSAGSDDTDMIGALQTTVTAAGTRYDKMQQLDTDLSEYTTEEDEAMYKYYSSRYDAKKLREAKDADGRKIIAPGAPLEVNQIPLQMLPGMTKGQVLLAAPMFYTAILREGINLMSDDGKVQIKEDKITYVSNVYSDGSPRKAFKRKVGASTNNNHDQNMHRYAEFN